MSRIKLSEDLRYWRAERPDEWTMDEFIRKSEVMEKRIADALDAKGRHNSQEAFAKMGELIGRNMTPPS